MSECQDCKYQLTIKDKCSHCHNCEQHSNFVPIETECKHEFPVHTYECYCSKCNKSMGAILQEENATLRKLIENMKCCQNCKYVDIYGDCAKDDAKCTTFSG